LKLKIDENLPAECTGILSHDGLEADTVADEGVRDPTALGRFSE
jgi:predicted nuclease of predicted toxin-antitoxin system